MENNEINTECCPKFEPALWDEKEFEWKGKKFIKDHVCTLFYIPLNFGSVMKRLDKKTRDANVNVPDYLRLSDHTSKWNMDLYLAVDNDLLDAKMVTISGKFISKVYEGNFKDTEKWYADFKEYAKTKNYEITKWYMWYTTCPKCAKKYGKNYVVIIGKID